MGRIPAAGDGASPGLAPGGETAGRQRLVGWRTGQLAGYDQNHDDLAGDATSRLSAYLRFGCVSPLEVAIGALDRAGGEQYCRQLAWRDPFYQVTAAFPDIARKNYRPGQPGPRITRTRPRWTRSGGTGRPGPGRHPDAVEAGSHPGYPRPIVELS
jgi:deoxyribodipyrimidine photo-lyase